MPTLSDRFSVTTCSDGGPGNGTDKPAVYKKRTRRSSNYRPYVCGCGKSYQSYPAIYTHAKNKHDGNLIDGSYHVKNGEKRAIKSSKFKGSKTGFKREKVVSGRLHFSQKFAQTQKIKEVNRVRVSRSNLQIAPIAVKADPKVRRVQLCPKEALRPAVLNLLEQNGLRSQNQAIHESTGSQPQLSWQQLVLMTYSAVDRQVFPSFMCAPEHIQQSLQKMYNQNTFSEGSGKLAPKPASCTIYEYFAEFLVFVASFLEQDEKHRAFLSETILMICLLCQTLNFHGMMDDKLNREDGKSSGNISSSDKLEYLKCFQQDITTLCRTDREFCANPNSKLEILTKLMTSFLALYFPSYWSMLLK